MIHNNYTDIIIEKVGRLDNLISCSRSGFVRNHPKHLAVFNANIIINGEKVWYGDLDLSISKDNLQSVAKQENVDLYVLFESDGRFDKEDEPYMERPVAIYHKDGTILYSDWVELKRYEGLGTKVNKRGKLCI